MCEYKEGGQEAKAEIVLGTPGDADRGHLGSGWLC